MKRQSLLMMLLAMALLLFSCQSTEEINMQEDPLTLEELAVMLSYPEYFDDIEEIVVSNGYEMASVCSIFTEKSAAIEKIDRNMFFDEHVSHIVLENIVRDWIEDNLENPEIGELRDSDSLYICCSFDMPVYPMIHVVPGTGFTRSLFEFLVVGDEAYCSVGDPEFVGDADRVKINGRWVEHEPDDYNSEEWYAIWNEIINSFVDRLQKTYVDMKSYDHSIQYEVTVFDGFPSL